jgi:hypothetical protein
MKFTASIVIASPVSRLEAGCAISLRARGAGMLRIREGRVWVTRDATARRASEDLVLGPGAALAVAPGERLVMEPWDHCGASYEWEAGPPPRHG